MADLATYILLRTIQYSLLIILIASLGEFTIYG